MKKGIIVSFEGIDGCGKSTQSEKFYGYLKKKGLPVIFLREPGGTGAGEKIRKILLENDAHLCVWSELFLYLASRAQLVSEVIEPSFKKGNIIILDRYFDSTIAYQCYGRELPIHLIEKIHEKFLRNLKPDITFLIDEKPEKLAEVLQRKKKDRIEKESLEFQKKVRDGFLKIAGREKRVRVIKRKTVEQSFRDIVEEWECFYQ